MFIWSFDAIIQPLERAMSTLFGHRRQAIPGAGADRRGLLQEADGGVLFLDEIDELGLDEQAMILHAVETGKYLPLGADYEVTSRFHLIAGAGRALAGLVAQGKFRADLFARLNLWTFTLPALRDRPEDIAPNIEYELARVEKLMGNSVSFNTDAFTAYQKFATDPDMQLLTAHLGDLAHQIDEFDRVQLAAVIRVCQTTPSLSAAGRRLFAASRASKTSRNDADRLRKYLDKFGLDWSQCQS